MSQIAAEPPELSRLTRQTLMMDADDTLWENNIHFERAISRFIDLVAHPVMSPAEVRAAFDALESARVKVHGYGTTAFHASLLAGFNQLTGSACDDEQARHIAHCAAAVRDAGLELLDGVADTLPMLAARHTLILVTKGDHGEQTAKLERSGLAGYFTHVEVLPEKHSGAYALLLSRYSCNPAETWMIGNSPRSDVNPALTAGMNAVYLPHPSTWILEQEPVLAPAAPQRLLRFRGFRDLLLHFA